MQTLHKEQSILYLTYYGYNSRYGDSSVSTPVDDTNLQNQ